RPPAKPVGKACDDTSALTAPLPDAASVWVAHLLRAAVSPPTRRRSSPARGRLAPYHLPEQVGEMVEIDFGGEGGSHWVLCCRLLPTPPNSTPQLAFLRRLTGWFRAV